MTTQNTGMVAGECVVDLFAALKGLTSDLTRDGMATIEGTVGPPAVRALMRVEAELLLADADAHAAGEVPSRTDGQRRHDALLLLVERMGATRQPT